MNLDILICGIGGQGVVMLGSFLRQYLLHIYNTAYIVGTESRGVSQREGSVISTVRIDTEGNSFFGPEIPPHEADIIIGMEPIEVLRNIDYAHNKTVLFVNRNAIIPKNIILDDIKKGNQKKMVKSNELGINFHDSREIISEISDLIQTLPSNTKKKIYSVIDINIQEADEAFPELTEINRLSKLSNLVDFELTNLMLKQFESTSLMNFVFLGILSSFRKEFDFDRISSFIKQFYRATDKNQDFINRNLSALTFGKNIAYQYKKKIGNY